MSQQTSKPGDAIPVIGNVKRQLAVAETRPKSAEDRAITAESRVAELEAEIKRFRGMSSVESGDEQERRTVTGLEGRSCDIVGARAARPVTATVTLMPCEGPTAPRKTAKWPFEETIASEVLHFLDRTMIERMLLVAKTFSAQLVAGSRTLPLRIVRLAMLTRKKKELPSVMVREPLYETYEKESKQRLLHDNVFKVTGSIYPEDVKRDNIRPGSTYLEYKSRCVEESFEQLKRAIHGAYVRELIVSASLETTLASRILSGCTVGLLTYQSTELPSRAGTVPLWPVVHANLSAVKCLSVASERIEDYGPVTDAFLRSCIQRGTSMVAIKNACYVPLRITDDGILDFLFGEGASTNGVRVLVIGHASVSSDLMKKLAHKAVDCKHKDKLFLSVQAQSPYYDYGRGLAWFENHPKSMFANATDLPSHTYTNGDQYGENGRLVCCNRSGHLYTFEAKETEGFVVRLDCPHNELRSRWCSNDHLCHKLTFRRPANYLEDEKDVAKLFQ